MKKGTKISLLVVFIFIIIWVTFFVVDSSRARNDKEPVFAIYTIGYEDGGSKKYTGLFYNVYWLHYFNPLMNSDWENEDGTLKEEYLDKEFITGVKVTPWFYKIDKVKDNY